MGCDCSAPKKAEEKLDIDAKTKTQHTIKQKSGTALSDSSEPGSNDTHSKLTWYHEPDEKEDGDILQNICSIIGDSHTKEIEDAIKNVKIKDDISAVYHYLLNAATSIDIDIDLNEIPKHECKDNINACSSFVRITVVLEAYIKWIKTAQCGKGKSIYDIINGGDLGKQFNNKQILDDYHHLMYCHDKDEEFQIIYKKLVSKQLVIAINKSSIIMRNYRDRSKMNEKQRKKLYFGYTESKDITIIKLLDRIYCFFVYSFDIGMRLTMKEKLNIFYAKDTVNIGEKTENKSNELCKDPKLVCMSSIISKKQINLINIIGKERMETNKFITTGNIENEAVIFYYKESEAKSDEIISIGGRQYTEKDWFVTTKFDNLKDELIDKDGKCKMNKMQFDDLINLSTLHGQCQHYMQLRQTMLDLQSVELWKMDNIHIMALMIYCNFTSIEYELKKTYFRLNEKETNESIKKRHGIFGHLGGLLKEIVCEYGMQFDQKSRINTFYHSISIESISMTLIKFVAPTSLSTSKVVLFNYSSISGIIIELNSGYLDVSGGNKPKYFDCSWISDIGIEEEKLFIAERYNPLELTSIIDINGLYDYQLFVMCLNIITIIFGEINESSDKLKKNPFDAIPKKQLKELTKKVLIRRAVQCQPHLFGKKKKNDGKELMLLQLLEQFCISRKEITLYWFSDTVKKHWKWMKELLKFIKDTCFCKKLKNKSKWIKLDLLSLFFINMECLIIMECPINEDILTEIELFIGKLQIDPKEKHKKEIDSTESKTDENDQNDIDKLMGLDVDKFLDDLNNPQKSHISFKDPNFNDFCDYRLCKIKQIKILESYDQQNYISFVNDEMLTKYNERYKKNGWQMIKEKVVGNYDGFIFRKIK